MKKFLFFLSLTTGVYSQNSTTVKNMDVKNTLNVGFFGDASLISINYERLFYFHEELFLNAKLGLGHKSILVPVVMDEEETYTTYPHHLTLNYSLNTKRSFFGEIGVGGVFMVENFSSYREKSSIYRIYPILGLRFHPQYAKKLMFRGFLLAPYIPINDETPFSWPFGFSIGLAF